MKEALHRIWSLVVKEFLLLSRDKVLMGFIILGPLLELALMGNMVGGGIANLPLGVVDLDRGQASRELVARLERTDELLIRLYSDSVDDAQQGMQVGEIAATVVIPPGYGETLADPRQSAQVQVILDDSNYVVELVAAGAVEQVAAEIAQDLASRSVSTSEGPLRMQFMALFNGALDGRPNSITALLGLIVYQVTLVIAAQSFTRERELGTLEQLRITPLSRVELIVGKAIPTLMVGMVNALLMIGVVVIWFDVPVRGSLLLLMLLTVPFVLVQVGWGTLISLVSRTQQQSVLFVFAVAMLEVACSGFIVPASDMPAVMRVVSTASSVQHYLIILRSVMLRGAGLGSLWVPFSFLMGISVTAAVLAWLRLRAGLETDSLLRRVRACLQDRAECLERFRPKRPAKDRRVKRRKKPALSHDLA
jgi:ABC-2 type transport system permease protein